jgi:UDP-N-acetylmuramyl pentapeptide phosphotransferase/UDP-N-acetylglucosamine-1-phosphate transferase
MNNLLLPIIPFVVAFTAVAILHPQLVRLAREKNIVDNPNTRKLQLSPVPVLGGIAIFFGIILGAVSGWIFVDCSSLVALFAAMMIMTYVGATDDILDISAGVRFAAQVLSVLILIYAGDWSLNNFHGLWGIEQLPEVAAIGLTIVAVVGIINSLNLIDGVDGQFSLYCTCICLIFAAIFYSQHDLQLFVVAIAACGSLIPFMLHNAFGKSSKMFAGDSGSLLMGVIISTFVMEIISNPIYEQFANKHNIGLVPFAFALLSIPVFDTLRVMTARIIKGGSPFVGDKTHLHHMFIDLGFSHLGTALSVVSLNMLIVGIWWATVSAGASVDVQFYVVIGTALLFDGGLYYTIALCDRLAPERMARLREWKREMRPNRKYFQYIQKLVDKF